MLIMFHIIDYLHTDSFIISEKLSILTGSIIKKLANMKRDNFFTVS